MNYNKKMISKLKNMNKGRVFIVDGEGIVVCHKSSTKNKLVGFKINIHEKTQTSSSSS